MLQGINRIGRSWVGRVVVGVLFGFLIISFAIWGIGDIFRGQVRTQVATVGKQDITAEAYRTAYQNEYQSLIRRTRQSITPEQARALGLDRSVLARLVTETALDQKARELKLTVSDQQVVDAIQNDPNFRGPSGEFDRAQFTDLLRSNGLSEAQYVRDQRAVMARLQLAEAVSGEPPVPTAMREAVHRFQNERRSLDYVALTPAQAGEIPVPTEAQLQSFFDERKATYRAPEYRGFTYLVLDAAALAKPEAVTDEEARRHYEQVASTRFGTPERRTVQQIVFPTVEEANAAKEKLQAGTSFEELAKERNVDEATLNLGTFAKAEMIDPAAAEAAFALAEGAVSDPVPGRFGPVILRVTKIEPGSRKPYDEVAAEVKRELATERAKAEIERVHDAIEDQRAGAKPLAEIARERGLTLVTVAAIDRGGRDKAGNPVATIPEPTTLVPAVFRSDVGADNEALRTPGGGYIWYDVTGVEPARDRTLAEVRDRVAEDWKADEVQRRLADKAREMVEKLNGGAEMAAVAGEAGLTPVSAGDVTRADARPDLPRAVVTRAFATPVGKAADAATETGRTVFKVTAASVPPFVTSTQQAAAVENQLRQAVAEDLFSQYVAEVERQIGVRTYPENMRRAIGAES
ncbi:peptidylprolyl isomerase [Enterovirga aerilata]|uniref:Parvulin-like PPIase n=1 Tax=Enterovirga aerilata TaxID=2730920 RepID=A0A849I7D3_9HYPH|nr:peptidylprolyl isomerase [Enterovirga sp. DB1703]NNM71937.1 peptidylprolyl isomerase [Enterovirga sp. DB1703]